MATQIPLFRAKKIDSDEFVEGHYNFTLDNKHILATPWVEIIDPSTLAIHFPDMIDSEENKIFASLSEDGKGGDLLIRYCYLFFYQTEIKIIKPLP